MSAGAAVFEESAAGQVIQRALEKGRLAHALLLFGPDMEALEAFARHTAARLLGLGVDWADSNASHPDFLTLRPSGKIRQIKIGGRDGAENNTMRQFIRLIGQTPLSAPRKVAVLYEAEQLNAASANAFLKTLEEPPADTTLLLLTTRPYSLLATIRSRCLHFRIPKMATTADDDPELAAWLEDYRQWLRDLAALAGRVGAPRASHGRLVMTVYGLVARFSVWLEKRTAEACAALKEQGAFENLDNDEAEALKSSTAIDVRNRFLALIEEATCAIARENPATAPAAIDSVKALENLQGLLRANLNINTGLENYLLQALRAWARRD
ncbi:MAG: DNA polymerase III subunit gamma/tau [Verrucomicrobia bacterium]|nr:MAG: DNA polymerase III subunit gamma/tau [Verrucomicrobiota bacterium]